MNTIWIEALLIFLLILLNGLLALSELALVSARKSKLEQLANEGNLKARIALNLSNSPDNFLSTIQIGITFVGILAGAFGGATIAESLSRYITLLPGLSAYSSSISVTVVVICITYFSILIGELIPKKIALNNPEKLALLVAPAIYRFSKIMHPLATFLTGSTNIFLKFMRYKETPEQSVTEEEIKLLIDKGTQAGEFQEFEQETIERVFRLADRRVSVLMTPRSDIVWLDLNESESETKQIISRHKYSYYPVAKDTLDNIVGVIRGKEILSLLIGNLSFNLNDICHKPLFISETTLAVKAMELFKKTKIHIAFVVDEYGIIQGLVTFDDILRSVFEDVEDSIEGKKEIVEREDGSLLISGSLPLDEFLDYISSGKLSDEELLGMNTTGGFVMSKLGAVPVEGQHFIWRDYRFEVVDMDGRRVDKILVSRIKNIQGTVNTKHK
jgi:putative hemolysin